MDGDEGGVAVVSRLRPELEGGDVEGTVRLTTGESSPSPVRGTNIVSEGVKVPLFLSCSQAFDASPPPPATTSARK